MVHTDLVYALNRAGRQRVAVRHAAVLLAAVLLATAAADSRAQSAGSRRIPILLVTGQSSIYHDWRKSSPEIERMLDETGLFDVDVATTPAAGESMEGFAPDWAAYAAVVLDYDGDSWPAPTRAAFSDWLAAGRGLVLVHAADNAFPDWPEFQLMAGVGGWRGRDESAGPKLRWRDGRAVLDEGPGVAQHPPQHDFQVVTRAADHPIMRGLPAVWMQANDELYSQLRGPARDVTILATALAEPPMRGATGEHEPMLMAIRYGDGRVFHTTLGHVGPRDTEPVATISSVGFIVTLQRGTEWAATGEVTQAVPADFPGSERPSLRAAP
jgi:type 1 glutamine amidotransferase